MNKNPMADAIYSVPPPAGGGTDSRKTGTIVSDISLGGLKFVDSYRPNHLHALEKWTTIITNVRELYSHFKQKKRAIRETHR